MGIWYYCENDILYKNLLYLCWEMRFDKLIWGFFNEVFVFFNFFLSYKRMFIFDISSDIVYKILWYFIVFIFVLMIYERDVEKCFLGFERY